MKKKLVYIAGPYTNEDPVINTRKTIDAWKTLTDAGYAAIVPHLSLLLHLVYPHESDFWYEQDLQILERCDILLRLPGDSWGADREMEVARERGILVFQMTAGKFVDAIERIEI